MKRSIFTLIGLLIITIICSTGFKDASNPFEGIITYKISFTDSKLQENQMTMFPKIMMMSIKGTKSKTEMTSVMGNTVVIYDLVEKSKVVLMDMMGQKNAIKSSREDIEKELAKSNVNVTVEVTAQTKVIAGYTCKKAVITDNGNKLKYDVYFTNEIGAPEMNFDNPMYKKINGVMMEFSMKSPQMTMVFSATSVEKKTLSAKDFEIPEGYKITTMEDFQKSMGKKGK